MTMERRSGLSLRAPLRAGARHRCSAPDGRPSGSLSFVFDFASERAGWVAGYSDDTPAVEGGIGFIAELRPLPAPLDQSRVAPFISGR